MKLSSKAALYSALVCPGAGFFLLKRYGLALAFLLPTSVALIYVVHYAMQIAQQLSQEILNGQTNIAALSAEVQAATEGDGSVYYGLAKLVFLLCWLGSIALCYWLGKRDEARLARAAHQLQSAAAPGKENSPTP